MKVPPADRITVDLARHASDKVARIMDDTFDLISDPGQRAAACIGVAGAIFGMATAHMMLSDPEAALRDPTAVTCSLIDEIRKHVAERGPDAKTLEIVGLLAELRRRKRGAG